MQSCQPEMLVIWSEKADTHFRLEIQAYGPITSKYIHWFLSYEWAKQPSNALFCLVHLRYLLQAAYAFLAACPIQVETPPQLSNVSTFF